MPVYVWFCIQVRIRLLDTSYKLQDARLCLFLYTGPDPVRAALPSLDVMSVAQCKLGAPARLLGGARRTFRGAVRAPNRTAAPTRPTGFPFFMCPLSLRLPPPPPPPPLSSLFTNFARIDARYI